jgi:GT2 family glycosyltransferase
MSPFFTIISVAYNDAWSLTKSARSVFRQSFSDFEYIVVDGASLDGTRSLIEFWVTNGLISNAVSEPDTGVYNAMNKGISLAKGEFVCFLNAGDVFANDLVLAKAHEVLAKAPADGVLGWGELNGQIWASWAETEAFKLASLGFCHQSLFVKRALLLDHPFDERPFKTDSDTRQLGRLYAAGARIPIIPEVFAVRGGEPGISANISRTKVSIINTLIEEYPGIDEICAEQIVMFRRQCTGPLEMCALLENAAPPLQMHLAYMVLDTLLLRQSKQLSEFEAERLYDCAYSVLASHDVGTKTPVDKLLDSHNIRQTILEENAATSKALKSEIVHFGAQEKMRISKLQIARNARCDQEDYVVSLTSFPARISTLHFVIQSLVEQTCPPREIHLWLGKDEIRDRGWLPSALLEFEKQGLQVHFVNRTCHQYDKYLHNSSLNNNSPFVIVDDDVIYPPHSMESLLNTHRAHPHAVIANRCHLIGMTTDGAVEKYGKWLREIQVAQPRLRAIPTGAGGVLYPLGFLCEPMVTSVQDILAHAPYADDIWLKVCALARGIPTMSTPLSRGSDWYLRYTPTMKAGALHATNVDLGLNDLQIQRCFEWLSNQRPAWRLEFLDELLE